VQKPGLKDTGAGMSIKTTQVENRSDKIDFCDDAGSGKPGCEEIEELKRRIIELQKENADLTDLLQGKRFFLHAPISPPLNGSLLSTGQFANSPPNKDSFSERVMLQVEYCLRRHTEITLAGVYEKHKVRILALWIC
jgi:hypothetical protein